MLVPSNIDCILTTLETSHEEMFSSNVLVVEQYVVENNSDMSSTWLVSQVLMAPYVVVALVESLHHAPTAVWRLAESVMG